MNKQKYLVMAFTFLILIAITPFVFSKLMNAKLDKMVEKLNKDGYKIELIEDKSTYLKTDKVFLVDIPKDKLSQPFTDIKLKVETIFNNLPVTKVDFKGVIKKIEFAKKEDTEIINNFFKDKIKFFVSTPNFKIYEYRLKDETISDDGVTLSFKGIKGIFENDESKRNSLTIDDISFKVEDILLEMKNVKNNIFFKDKNIKNDIKFNFYAIANNNNVQVNNVRVFNNVLVDKRMNIVSKLSFDNLKSKFLNEENFIFNFDLLGVDKETFMKMGTEENPKKVDELSMELLKKGLKINLDSKAKKLDILEKIKGYYLIHADIKILPDENLEQDIKENNLKFLVSHIHYESNPEIARFFVALFPKALFIVMASKKISDNKIVTDIVIKNSKIYVNGKEIK